MNAESIDNERNWQVLRCCTPLVSLLRTGARMNKSSDPANVMAYLASRVTDCWRFHVKTSKKKMSVSDVVSWSENLRIEGGE